MTWYDFILMSMQRGVDTCHPGCGQWAQVPGRGGANGHQLWLPWRQQSGGNGGCDRKIPHQSGECLASMCSHILVVWVTWLTFRNRLILSQETSFLHSCANFMSLVSPCTLSSQIIEFHLVLIFHIQLPSCSSHVIYNIKKTNLQYYETSVLIPSHAVMVYFVVMTGWILS